jgi:hypothetical protein
MPCPQDPQLSELGVWVDAFQNSPNIYHYMLTHAHTDHMKGLTKHFQKKIYCSEITATLAQLQFSYLTPEHFCVLSEGSCYAINLYVEVRTFPSYHCRGSTMFLFTIHNSIHILYTGDFRFHSSFDVLKGFTIDRMYYDDTFATLPSLPFGYPTFRNSCGFLVTTVFNLLKCSDVPIHINVSILGSESMIQVLGETLHLKFQLSPGIQNTHRKAQLQYLLKDFITENDSHVILSHRNRDNVNNGVWIFPTCTYFYCSNTPFSVQRSAKHPNHVYVWFATHPNPTEIKKLELLVEPNCSNPCGEALGKLRCRLS